MFIRSGFRRVPWVPHNRKRDRDALPENDLGSATTYRKDSSLKPFYLLVHRQMPSFLSALQRKQKILMGREVRGSVCSIKRVPHKTTHTAKTSRRRASVLIHRLVAHFSKWSSGLRGTWRADAHFLCEQNVAWRRNPIPSNGEIGPSRGDVSTQTETLLSITLNRSDDFASIAHDLIQS